MEKLDFPGSQYDFRPIDMAFSFDGLVNLDLGFNFLDKTIREDNKKWHYPCVAKLECLAQVEESTDYLALAMVLGQSTVSQCKFNAFILLMRPNIIQYHSISFNI